MLFDSPIFSQFCNFTGEKKADRMLKTHEAASHALFGNLLQILQALVSGEWASWIRGGKVK